jgi:threonine/homoserine efflux transporter RhtA
VLIFSTTPVFTSLFGYVFLEKSLTGVEWAGIAVTLLASPGRDEPAPRLPRRR